MNLHMKFLNARYHLTPSHTLKKQFTDVNICYKHLNSLTWNSCKCSIQVSFSEIKFMCRECYVISLYLHLKKLCEAQLPVNNQQKNSRSRYRCCWCVFFQVKYPCCIREITLIRILHLFWKSKKLMQVIRGMMQP